MCREKTERRERERKLDRFFRVLSFNVLQRSCNTYYAHDDYASCLWLYLPIVCLCLCLFYRWTVFTGCGQFFQHYYYHHHQPSYTHPRHRAFTRFSVWSRRLASDDVWMMIFNFLMDSLDEHTQQWRWHETPRNGRAAILYFNTIYEAYTHSLQIQ